MKAKIKGLKTPNLIKWLDSRVYKPNLDGNYLTLNYLGICKIRFYRMNKYGEVEGWISNEDSRQWQERPIIDDEVLYWSFMQFNIPEQIKPNPFSEEVS